MTDKMQPKIRFKGFTDPWEQRKLKDVSTKVNDKNANNKFSETLTNSAEYGIINQREFFDKDISNSKNLDNYYIVSPDDFVYNPRISNHAPVGPIRRNKLKRTGVMSPLYYVFRTHDIDKTFLEQYFYTDCWRHFMIQNGDSGARSDRFAIKDSVFQTMPIPIPTEIEQDKIGKFLSSTTFLIAANQNKVDQLKQLKKLLMQKVFSQEWRFKGFTDPWEQRKLGDLLIKRSRPVQMIDSKSYKLVTVKRRNNGIVLRGIYKGAEVKVKSQFMLKRGDFVISKRQVVHGADGIVPKSLEGAIVSNEYLILNGGHGLNTDFFGILATTPMMYKMFFLSSYGIDIEKLVFNVQDWEKRKITLPGLMEQEHINHIIKTLKSSIAANQRKLNQLKLLKKYLMQNMFV